MSALLIMKDVACLRGGRLLFEGFDLTLQPGEAVHVTGANGSGKSSMLRLVAGLLKPVAGTIERAECALADERLALDRDTSLDDALGFWIADEARRSEALAAVGLDLGSVPVRLLSTGQRQRARLARVIASDAPLWLLDEPLNGLDLDAAQRLERAIALHREKGGAVLAASHVPMAGDWRSVAL